ncbi:MAG: fatty acid desaturase, partial [Cyanobacteria bacterium 0813]|nr:fatty acid desaturase [Cyanobacteria bacterium 0813]
MKSEKLFTTVDKTAAATLGKETLIHYSVYAKKLRPFLPSEAFKPDASKLVIMFINMGILVLGWGIAARLDQWSVYLLWLYLPLALIMGNSVIALSFISHDFMHGSVQKKSRMTDIISFLGFAMLFMPPTQWKSIHNIVHHSETNSLG